MYALQCWSTDQVKTLMDISITLTDLTTSVTLLDQIPDVLSRTLELESITLAIVARSPHHAPPTLFFRGSSGPLADAASADTLNAQLLALHSQATRPAGELSPLPRPASHNAAVTCAQLRFDQISHPRATVFDGSVGSSHQLLLVVHHLPSETSLTSAMTDMFLLIAAELGRLLLGVIALQAQPDLFGEPFDELTPREWSVLRVLMMESGEKELARELGLSPHTIHSHIKSIYRKAKVGGRLSLIAKVQTYLRQLRMGTSFADRKGELNNSSVPVTAAS